MKAAFLDFWFLSGEGNLIFIIYPSQDFSYCRGSWRYRTAITCPLPTLFLFLFGGFFFFHISQHIYVFEYAMPARKKQCRQKPSFENYNT